MSEKPDDQSTKPASTLPAKRPPLDLMKLRNQSFQSKFKPQNTRVIQPKFGKRGDR